MGVNNCGITHCSSTGETQQAIFARLSFMTPSGGIEEYPYQAAIWFSDDVLQESVDLFWYAWSYGSAAWVPANQSFSLSIVVPDRCSVEFPCFSYMLKDASGHVIEPAPISKTLSELKMDRQQ